MATVLCKIKRVNGWATSKYKNRVVIIQRRYCCQLEMSEVSQLHLCLAFRFASHGKGVLQWQHQVDHGRRWQIWLIYYLVIEEKRKVAHVKYMMVAERDEILLAQVRRERVARHAALSRLLPFLHSQHPLTQIAVIHSWVMGAANAKVVAGNKVVHYCNRFEWGWNMFPAISWQLHDVVHGRSGNASSQRGCPHHVHTRRHHCR